MTRLCSLALVLVSGTLLPAAPILSEGFDDISALSGWTLINRSAPIGSTNWFQGNPGVFPAFAGNPDSYISGNFENAALGGNISNWLITPVVQLVNGATLSFYTRSAGAFPDRLEVRLNASGTTNVGVDDTTVGDFTTLLLTVNSALGTGYPTDWTRYEVIVSGLAGPTNATLGFRYFVPDTSTNADAIGIDSLEIADIPEPGTAALVAVALAAFVARKRRAS
ncbi:MAG: choice-of-anchor J domain-containing protein [Bryobacterales bacterium]|nr:choice-of-anchor J domain-containing protein [Bryobacterales bacterium]